MRQTKNMTNTNTLQVVNSKTTNTSLLAVNLSLRS